VPFIHAQEFFNADGTLSALVRLSAMSKRRRLPKALRRLPIVTAIAGSAALFYTVNTAEAEVPPDPAAVQRFLQTLEAREAAPIAKDDARKTGSGKRLRQMVESAAVRAPSTPVINKLETVVSRRLEG
jgi:hypothetical protein